MSRMSATWMKRVVKGIQVLYVLYAFVLFTVLLLIIFPLVLIVAPLGAVKGGNAIYRITNYWADIWLLLVGIHVQKIGLANYRKEGTYIFVANHISYMDVPMFVKLIRRPLRALGNEEMSRIPVFGFLYRRAAVTVNRSSPENRARSVKVLKSVLSKGVSIFIFPEGMFNETLQPLKTFYDGAFRIAIETQTPLQPVLFPDTVKRLHYSSLFSLTPGRSRAVFLPAVSVKGMTVKDVGALRDKVYAMMGMELIKLKD